MIFIVCRNLKHESNINKNWFNNTFYISFFLLFFHNLDRNEFYLSILQNKMVKRKEEKKIETITNKQAKYDNHFDV